MKKALVLLAAALSLAAVRLAPADEASDALQKDRNAIAGTWTIDSFEYDGKKPPADPNRPKLMVIMGADGSVRVLREGNTVFEASTLIDPSKTPKTIDVTYSSGERKGQMSHGIYEIDGDTLKICTARSGNERPQQFASAPGSGHVLIVYKRVKTP